MESEINRCFSSALVNGQSYVGGLVGQGGTISNSYANGSVSGGYSVGGLVGIITNVTNSYSSTIVNGAGQSGGLIGWKGDPPTGNILNSFWDKTTSGYYYSNGGVGLYTPQMKEISTFLNAGWDFKDETTNGSGDFWTINYTDNNGYPALVWQGFENVQYNLAIIDINAGNYPFTTEEDVSIDIKNLGNLPQTDFDVSFTYNGNTYTETVTATINFNETYTYSFNQKINMTVFGDYVITANVILPTDENQADNELTKTINTSDYNDLSIGKIIAGNYPYGESEEVTVEIYNAGMITQENFDISFTFQGNTYTETYTGQIAEGEIISHTFTQTVDMSEFEMYEISVNVVLLNDENQDDNTMIASINTNYLIIGTETNISYDLPVNCDYPKSYSQSIYLQSELGNAGTISQIAYYYAPIEVYAGINGSNQFKVYMDNTDKQEFSDYDDWSEITDFTLVFDGVLESPVSEGWWTIDLNTPFYYNGTDNLIIAVNEIQDSYDGNSDRFYVSTTPKGNYRSINVAYELEQFDINNPYDADNYYDYIPNLRISFAKDNDLKINKLTAGTYPFSNSENVNIEIRNLGLQAQSNFEISFMFNGNIVSETYTGTLDANQTLNYTFAQTINLSGENVYEISAFVGEDDFDANNYQMDFVNTIQN